MRNIKIDPKLAPTTIEANLLRSSPSRPYLAATTTNESTEGFVSSLRQDRGVERSNQSGCSIVTIYMDYPVDFGLFPNATESPPWYRYNAWVSGALCTAYGLVFCAGLLGNIIPFRLATIQRDWLTYLCGIQQVIF